MASMFSPPRWSILLGVVIGLMLLARVALLVAVYSPRMGAWVCRCLRKQFATPHWIVQEGFLAALIAGIVFALQLHFDENRAERDRMLAAQSADLDRELAEAQYMNARRLEDLRFVRERSTLGYEVRPFRKLDLVEMDLSGLLLNSADLTQADLSGANLVGTDLRSCMSAPIECNYHPGSTVGAFPVTLLAGTNLCNAEMGGVKLGGAFILKTNFEGVDLTYTDLRGAFLYGIDFRGVKNMPAFPGFLDNIYYDKIEWPEHFLPPESSYPPDQQKLTKEFFDEFLGSVYVGTLSVPNCSQ